MTDRSFSTSFVVDRSPEQVFDAVTDVRGWWSQEVEGVTDRVGGEFRYHFEDVHRSTIRVTELVPGRRVAWYVVENLFALNQNPTEWTGTTITFDISGRDGRTEVTFTHHGLVPEEECYQSCSTGWTFYVTESLPSLITTGSGRPNATGRARLEQEERASASARR